MTRVSPSVRQICSSMRLVQRESPTCAARFEQLLDLALCEHVVEQLNRVLGGVSHVESGWDRLRINMLNLAFHLCRPQKVTANDILRSMHACMPTDQA